MITQFKIFETIKNTNLEELKAGDYAILSSIMYERGDPDLIKFKDKIGKLIRVRQIYNEIDIDFGGDIGKMFGVRIFNIKCWSSDKKELEAFIAAEKYNL